MLPTSKLYPPEHGFAQKSCSSTWVGSADIRIPNLGDHLSWGTSAPSNSDLTARIYQIASTKEVARD